MKKYKLIKEYPGSVKLRSESINEFYKDYPEFWEEVVEKDYEILEIRVNKQYKDKTKVKKWTPENSYGLSLETMLNLGNCVKSGDFYIYSIKRLSDSEIFTVGDEIEFNIHYTPKKAIGTISEFIIYGNKIGFVDSDRKYNSLLDIIGNKIKKPLFTTEDGVDIFEEDKAYMVCPYWRVDEYEISKNTATDRKWFSTKEAAEEYILMNKPCLSINDIKSIEHIYGVIDNYNLLIDYVTKLKKHV
jgi:hypothetical protein